MKFQVTRRPWYWKDLPAWMVCPASDSNYYPCYIVKEMDSGDIKVFVEALDEVSALSTGKIYIEKYIQQPEISQWRKDLGQL